MSNKDIVKTIDDLRAIEAFIDELSAEAEELKDKIKSVMLERGVEELEAGAYIVRWSQVLSNRFDSASFKKIYGDLYKAFTKQVSSKRFSIS